MESQRIIAPMVSPVRTEELTISGSDLSDLMVAVISKGVPFRFRAKGRSMDPFIRDGDIITISPIQKNKLAIGDVVAFTHPQTGNVVVHRIVSRRKAGYIIQGDGGGPQGGDGMISKEKIIGIVTQVERNGHSVLLGSGLERTLIAWFSRTGRLVPIRLRVVSRLRAWFRVGNRL